jgi:predicted RNase H-like nuclease (RuvC/YqgF family)
MKLVSAALKEKQIQTKDLPQNLQDEVASLKGLIDKYNEAVDSYDDEDETDEDTERELDKMEDYIVETEKDLASRISNYDKLQSADGSTTDTKIETKPKDNSIGWLVFGTVVLVATVGMVNVFKKK